MSSGSHDGAVDRDDAVARLRGPRRPRASPGETCSDRRRRLPDRGHEEPGEQDEREQDVRGRPGGDRGDALPRRGAPVGVGPERVVEVVEALPRGRAPRAAAASRSSTSSRSTRSESRAASWSPAASAPRRRRSAADSAGASSTARPSPRSTSTARRAGASRGSSRSRRAGSRRCRTRCRCASSSRSPAGSRCRTAAAASRATSDTRKCPSSWTRIRKPRPTIETKIVMPAAASARRGAAPPRRPRRGRRGRARGAPSTRASVSSTTAAMSRNPMRPSRNAATATSLAALYAHGAVPPRSPAARASAEQRECVVVGRLERAASRPARGRAGSTGVAARVGIGERVRDRHAHVRQAEVREQRAVAEPHERVDDRRRVHDDLDRVVRHAEQPVRLDQLEALVRERRGVDRDLRPHRPGRMGERLLRGDAAEIRAGPAAERPAGGGQHERRRRVAGSRPSRHWWSAECSLSTGSSSPPPRAARRARARRRRRGSPCSRARA